jgi:hypothetical protein
MYRLETPHSMSEIVAASKPMGFDTNALALKDVDDVKSQHIVLIPKKAPIRQCYAKLKMGENVYYLVWENGKIMLDTLVPDQEQTLPLFFASKGMKLPDGKSRDEFFFNTEDRIPYPFNPSVQQRYVEFSLIAENYRFRRPVRFTLDINSFETIKLSPYAKAP